MVNISAIKDNKRYINVSKSLPIIRKINNSPPCIYYIKAHKYLMGLLSHYLVQPIPISHAVQEYGWLWETFCFLSYCSTVLVLLYGRRR